MTHVKEYNAIFIKYDTFIKKYISYANPTPFNKRITIKCDSQFVKVKEREIDIKSQSAGAVRLRMYFDRSASQS